MECDKCGEQAVLHVAYSGLHLCEAHLCQSVERRVRRRIREDNLLPDGATPENPERWVIALSGGKDSVVLTEILHDTFARDPRVELVALSIHEGIAGYRDQSLEACRELTGNLGIRHEVVSYDEEFDVRMDEVVETDPHDMSACAYCGVFRRDVLSRYAADLDADKLLTGHNLDDEAETALMNFLEGDIRKMSRQFDASLGPFEGADAARTRDVGETFVPRAKPLRDVPEREVALYARFRELPAHVTECPHAEEAYRGEIKQLLYDIEERHPGTRHSILSGYEELVALAADRNGDETTQLGECAECGSATARDVCRTCSLLEAL
jgi:uncharacterized protein (TIGR00269 family)